MSRPEEAHGVVADVVDLALRIVDRHRGDAEHLVAAGPAHRVDRGEAAAIADRQLRRVGARPEVFRHLELPRPLDHLEEERQAGDEPDHGDEPGSPRMGGDELLDAGLVVDPGGVVEIGGARVLVAVAKPHQRLVRPGVVVVDRELEDPRLDHRGRLRRRGLEPLQLGQHVVRLDPVGIELDLEGGVGRADLGDPVDPALAHRVGDRERLEEGLQRHALVDLDEDVLVAAEGVAVGHAVGTSPVRSVAGASRAAFSSSQRSSQVVW